jgi:hypothetical protein
MTNIIVVVKNFLLFILFVATCYSYRPNSNYLLQSKILPTVKDFKIFPSDSRRIITKILSTPKIQSDRGVILSQIYRGCSLTSFVIVLSKTSELLSIKATTSAVILIDLYMRFRIYSNLLSSASLRGRLDATTFRIIMTSVISSSVLNIFRLLKVLTTLVPQRFSLTGYHYEIIPSLALAMASLIAMYSLKIPDALEIVKSAKHSQSKLSMTYLVNI